VIRAGRASNRAETAFWAIVHLQRREGVLTGKAMDGFVGLVERQGRRNREERS